MKKTLFCILCWMAVSVFQLHAITFNSDTLYSRWMINSTIANFYNKGTNCKFATFADVNGIMTKQTDRSNVAFDYVPGLVAKSYLDAWFMYKDYAFATPWLYSINELAENFAGSKPTTSEKTLDDLNATKLYFRLLDAKVDNLITTSADYAAPINRAASSLQTYNTSQVISGTGTAADGGWWHKDSYPGQMWCDGAYMGPALLAQILEYKAAYPAAINCSLTWNDVVLQFTSSWAYLWDDNKKLLYHVFTVNPSGKNSQWSADHGYLCDGTTNVYHSEEYWGRACGWYFLALVDVLESMKNAGQDATPGYATLKGYLNQLADGLAARQDATTGCWYQLLQYDNTKTASRGSDATVTGSTTYKNSDPQANYLESSCSCIFAAAFLKGSRLGLFTTNYDAVAKKAYEGIIATFVTQSGDAISLRQTCQSAGLGSDRNGSAAYYLIGKDVNIQNSAEGKVLGPFILASIEYEKKYTATKILAKEAALNDNCNCLTVTIQ